MEAPGYQLRVREHPSYLAEVTGFIRDGQVLDITQEKGIWVRLANSTVDDLKETASFSDAKEYWTARVTGDGVMLKKLIDQPHDVASAERDTQESMSAEEKLQGLRDLYPEFTLSELSGVLQKNNYELGPAYYDCQSLKEMDFCEGRQEREMRAPSTTERKQATGQTARTGWAEDSPKGPRDPSWAQLSLKDPKSYGLRDYSPLPVGHGSRTGVSLSVLLWHAAIYAVELSE
ncbi:hypothetical protein CYMTET_5043 [Cymbomonas tetramitiformis]|uniref:Uncharacterized protein n=1 Tax=Cymbomonas tetramitiformis TaxID=36881 RepID=A0AAE0H076_9CHLO|nr:hypothetical protein CYMTET_5043 [Cymbomonas tetramitiformis]